MIEITDITDQKNKNRRNLYVDGKFFSGIELETLIKNKIKIGDTFFKDDLVKIIDESEQIVAFNKALKYALKGLKSEYEIAKNLREKGYLEKTINAVIEKMQEYNYINDEVVVETYVNYFKEVYGKNKIKQNLLSKKIDEELIIKYLDYEENNEKLRKTIEKYLKNKEKNLKIKQNLINHLIYKGYKFDDFNSILKEYFND